MRADWRVLGLFVCLCISGVVHAEPTARLHGRVTCEGRPVAGATVMVNRAWPIKGIAYYCPGCYLDCGKSATTDDTGAWAIGRLDSSLKFELLVVAKGHAPKRTGVVDPTTGGGVEIAVASRDVTGIAKERVVTGRVVDGSGKAVKGAVVSPEMVYTETGGCGGMCDGLDELDVTDDEGAFTLTYKEACRAMDLAVSARGYAHTCFPGRLSGGKVHELKIGEGVSVTGRLRRDGAPVRDVEVTLLARSSQGGAACVERQVIATGKDGEFLFVNVLAGQRYVLSAATDQLGKGCVVPKGIDVTGDRGAEVDVGTLEVVKGVRVTGKVVMEDGGELPEMKLTLSSEAGWDGVTRSVGPSGVFEFPEVAPGAYSLYVAARGAYASMRNRSADTVNLGGLFGRVDADIQGLELELTRTRPVVRRPDDPGSPPELGGVEKGDGTRVEASPVKLTPRTIAGRVTWKGKGLGGTLVTVAGVQLAEGGVLSEHHPDDKQWAITDEDGRFELPVIQAPAVWLTFAGPEGQWAQQKGVAGGADQGFALQEAAALQAGQVCRVRVVDSGRRPVRGAIVVPTQYVSGMGGGWSGELACGARRTDEKGEATVGIAVGERAVVRNTMGLAARVICEGYAPRDVPSMAFDDSVHEVILDEGARVRGSVRGASGPVAGAMVMCMPAASAGDRTVQRRAVRTDEKGEFVFEHVPASCGVWVVAPAWGNSAGVVAGPVTVQTPAAGMTVDAALPVGTSGHMLAGRLVLEGARAPKAGSWVSLSHEGAWLGWAAPLGKKGEFAFTGVPDGGPYTLHVSGSGDVLSLENASASRYVPMALRGMITRDHPGLEIRALPAGAKREAVNPRELPLRGVEGLSAK